MIKTLVLSIITALLFSSCLTLNYGGKKTFILIDPPNDLIVKNKGKRIEIKEYIAYSRKFGNTTTNYYKPGFAFKLKKNNTIEFISSGKSATTTIKGNPAIGIVFLVLEFPITLGIGTIIDIATASYYYPKERYIDVQAIIQGTKPRSKEELNKYIGYQ